MHYVIACRKGRYSSPYWQAQPVIAGHAASAALTQGPVYTLEVSGGACTEDAHTGRVTCTRPAVMLSKAAGGCNFAYTGPSVVQACPLGALLPICEAGSCMCLDAFRPLKPTQTTWNHPVRKYLPDTFLIRLGC